MIDWKRLVAAVFLSAAAVGCQPNSPSVSSGSAGLKSANNKSSSVTTNDWRENLAIGSGEVYKLSNVPTEAELTELIETWNSTNQFDTLEISFSLAEHPEFDLLTLKKLKGLHGLTLHGVEGEEISEQVNAFVLAHNKIEGLVLHDSGVSGVRLAPEAKGFVGLVLENCRGTLDESLLHNLKLLGLSHSNIEFPKEAKHYKSLKALAFAGLKANQFPYDCIANQELDWLQVVDCEVSGSEFRGWREPGEIQLENLPIDDAGLKVLLKVFPDLPYNNTYGSKLTARSISLLLEEGNRTTLTLNGISLDDGVELDSLAANRFVNDLSIFRGKINKKQLGQIIDSLPSLHTLSIDSDSGLSPSQILELRLTRKDSQLVYFYYYGEVTEEDEIAYAENVFILRQVDPEEHDPEE